MSNRPAPPVTEVLDEAGSVVTTVAAPWLGVFWLTSLPVRALQGFFLMELVELGPEASSYGDHLTQVATAVFLALLAALLGRAVFVRACHLALLSQHPPDWTPLRMAPAATLGYAYAALLLEVLFFATAPALVTLPICATLSGLAAATHVHLKQPSLIEPLRRIAEAGSHPLQHAALLLVFAAAMAIALVNLYFVFQLGLWLLGAVPGVDTGPWLLLLSLHNPRFLVLVGIGGVLLIEPFWLAALTVFVHKVRSRESGEDLSVWFASLRESA